jgi:hypothetical protein
MTARLTRLLAAVFLLIGGIIHYTLWTSGYRFIPKIGPLFMANFLASIVLAAAVMMSRRATVGFAGIAFAAGSLAAVLLSRSVGVFGFTEPIWTSQAITTVISEIGAIATLAVAVAIRLRTAPQSTLQPAFQLAPRRTYR